jgi:hypothetical protein
MSELQRMRDDPRGLFEVYVNLLVSGEYLTDGQLAKFEYLKTLFLKED